MYFALVMLKRVSSSESSDPPIHIPATAVAGTSAQSPIAEPQLAQPVVAAPQPVDPNVAIEPSEPELEPSVATPSKAKTSSTKKIKKKK